MLSIRSSLHLTVSCKKLNKYKLCIHLGKVSTYREKHTAVRLVPKYIRKKFNSVLSYLYI